MSCVLLHVCVCVCVLKMRERERNELAAEQLRYFFWSPSKTRVVVTQNVCSRLTINLYDYGNSSITRYLLLSRRKETQQQQEVTKTVPLVGCRWTWGKKGEVGVAKKGLLVRGTVGTGRKHSTESGVWFEKKVFFTHPVVHSFPRSTIILAASKKRGKKEVELTVTAKLHVQEVKYSVLA